MVSCTFTVGSLHLESLVIQWEYINVFIPHGKHVTHFNGSSLYITVMADCDLIWMASDFGGNETVSRKYSYIKGNQIFSTCIVVFTLHAVDA